MNLSDAGVDFLARWEGRRNRPYNDQLGHCTVGIGHLLHLGGCTTAEFAQLYDDDQVDELFRSDVARFVDAVNAAVAVPLTQPQFDALVSFAFNWGTGAGLGFEATSVVALVNAGDFAAAATELVDGHGPSGRRYDKGLDGVRRRRIAEAEWLRSEAPMSGWHPRARRIEPVNTSAGSYRVDCPYKLVLHTVEGGGYSPSRDNYYGHQSYPHATIDENGIWQHFPIDVAARALYNAGGGVETNTARAIQVEIVWWAGRIHELPEATMAHLADWVQWLLDEDLIPITFAEFKGDGSYGEDASQRYVGDEWYSFAGICGHQHVPENDHWDPGAFPIERLMLALGAPPPEEDDMFTDDDRRKLDWLVEVVEARKAPKGLDDNTRFTAQVADELVGAIDQAGDGNRGLGWRRLVATLKGVKRPKA